MMCGGSARSRITATRVPSVLRSRAGTGAVSTEYVLLNQKCRASDLKSGVGIEVAITTRFVRIVPPAVLTSASYG